MVLPTDAVLRNCVDNNNKCSLSNKCDVCKAEIKSLNEIDEFFDKRLEQLFEKFGKLEDFSRTFGQTQPKIEQSQSK